MQGKEEMDNQGQKRNGKKDTAGYMGEVAHYRQEVLEEKRKDE